MKTPLLLGCAFAFCVTGCHSASWTPPEPQQAPAASATPPVGGTQPNAEPIASAAPSAPSASATAEPAPPTSSEAAATAPPATAAAAGSPPSPAGKGAPKASAHKEAHQDEGAAAGSTAYDGPDPCRATTFHYSAIGSACKKGGRKAVKDIMRGVVKKAKDAGEDVKCTSCHEDTSSYHLKGNAVSDIKRWF